jgi:LAO/AO transport system kinase
MPTAQGVANMVDMYVLVVPPGGGDVLQGLKRGIVELVDLILVNKADGDLLPAAQRAKREYLAALKLLRRRTDVWTPTVVLVSSLNGDNIDLAWETMQEYHACMRASGALDSKRRAQSKLWMWQHITDDIVARFRETPRVSQMVLQVEKDVQAGVLTSGQGADLLLNALDGKL